MKIYQVLIVFAFLIINSIFIKASEPQVNLALNSTKEKESFIRIENRINQIKSTDKSTMSNLERSDLQYESKSNYSKMANNSGGGGVYLSGGAIIIIILLLILIL